MTDKITNTSVQEFLKDFLTYSETQILEEGKEKDDILEVATARGYNLRNNSDLAGFKTIFTFADKANKNRARLPKEKLLKALPGMIGKPVDIDHIRNFVVGHYIDYRYKASEDMVVAYGVFYKSNFGDEWATAQKLFKAGKLGTSYEIWCPKSKRKMLSDGTYELTEMEIAGGGLMFKEKPAFEDAKVLEIAKLRMEEHSTDLVIASIKQYDASELIASAEVTTAEKAKAIDKIAFALPEPIKTTAAALAIPVATPSNVAPVAPVVTPIIPKIVCGNCKQEFDNTGMIATQSEKKCPNCKAIVGEQGEVKYPPQVMDFNVSCPSCNSSNWLLIKNEEANANIKCVSCSKQYNLGFEKIEPNELVKHMAFVYISSTSCPQCGSHIPFSTTSQAKNKSLTCSHCALQFNIDISKIHSKRKISKIEELADLSKASAEGGKEEMDQNTDMQNQPAEVVVPVEALIVETVAQAEVVAEVVIEAPVVAAEVPAEAPIIETPAPVAEVQDVPVVAAEVVNEPVVETLVEVSTPEVAAEVVVAPVVEIVEVPVEAAIEPKKVHTEEEIEEMEKEICKIGEKNKKYKNFFKAACKKLREMKKAAKLNKASEDENISLKEKIQLLESSAVKVIERKNMLGEFGKDLSEKDMLDDDKFELAKIKKENAELQSKLVTASTHISVKSEVKRSSNELAHIAKSINDKAFPQK